MSRESGTDAGDGEVYRESPLTELRNYLFRLSDAGDGEVHRTSPENAAQMRQPCHDDVKMRITQARTRSDIEAIRTLFREYEAYLGVDLCFQDFEKELASLPGRYSPPHGCLFLARDENGAVGCVALRRLTKDACEMKRLYVRPEARGRGLGTLLAKEIIRAARDRGYSVMRLDTLDRLEEAMQLYRSLGFRECPPYYENPLPGVVYWELVLANEVGEGRGDKGDVREAGG